MTQARAAVQRLSGTPQSAKRFALDPATSRFLDLCRWGAAFLVVLSHVRSLVLANYSEIRFRPGLLVKAIYFASGFGHIAVVLFFVISGFLVGGLSTMKAKERHLSILDYTIDRFSRIYVVLVPALLIGFTLDTIGSRMFDGSGLYTHLSPFHLWSIDYSITNRLSLATLLGNLALLQTIFVQPLGSNAPLWSLANEWWYYVLFGLVVALTQFRSTLPRVACLGSIIGLVYILPIGITLWAVLWVLGAGVAWLDRHWRGWPVPVGLIPLVAVMVVERYVTSPERLGQDQILWQFLYDLLVAVSFSLALLCAKRGRWRFGRIHKALASFSYSVYLVHFPAMVLLVAVMQNAFRFGMGEQPELAALAFVAALIAVLYLYAWALSSLTETQTRNLRDVLRRTFDAMLGDGASWCHNVFGPTRPLGRFRPNRSWVTTAALRGWRTRRDGATGSAHRPPDRIP